MNRLHYNLTFHLMLFILLCAVCCSLSPASAASVDVEIIRIQKAYENIKDIRGSFIQKSFMKDLKKTETFKGQFFIKRPMQMKWSYEGNNAQ
ncbi:MAG: outer membrane lipoprotein carrier protein LolA, partial [Thermodesulfovibrionales bacterium]|nr:outer membrane lipoprotein carrier protein LolA [Thermodesulfovibrionales bacterium]